MWLLCQKETCRCLHRRGVHISYLGTPVSPSLKLTYNAKTYYYVNTWIFLVNLLNEMTGVIVDNYNLRNPFPSISVEIQLPLPTQKVNFYPYFIEASISIYVHLYSATAS